MEQIDPYEKDLAAFDRTDRMLLFMLGMFTGMVLMVIALAWWFDR